MQFVNEKCHSSYLINCCQLVHFVNQLQRKFQFKAIFAVKWKILFNYLPNQKPLRYSTLGGELVIVCFCNVIW